MVNDPPVVTCIEVHNAGDVTIYWQSLDLSALEFNIFYSTDQITWTQAGSVDTQNQSLSFNHLSARADTAMYYYYIRAVYPTAIDSSGIFSTIFLEVDNSTIGMATCYWNPVSTPLPQGSSTYYKIYKSVYKSGPPDVWTFVDSTQNTLYNYTIEDGLCYDSINFRIEIANSYGCSSVSNISGDWFSEDNQPEQPILDSVSIINNNEIIIGWEASTSPDVKGTIIYKLVGTIWITIDTVFGNENTYYIDDTYDACAENFMYAIAATDSCGIPSPKTEITAQRPIYFSNIDYNLCARKDSLTWEHYVNAIAPFNKYEIWLSKNGGNFQLFDEVPSSQNYYVHNNVESNTSYSYLIRAVFNNSSYTSTSCAKSITTGSFVIPDSVYFANANVLTTNKIELTLDVDLKPTTCTWQVFRSDAGGTTQTLLTTFNRADITVSPYVTIDESADGSLGSFNYSVNVIDSCGYLQLQSNTLKTIFLQGVQISNTENKLSWNLFEGWDESVGKYYIYRMLGDIVPTQPIDSVNGQVTEYLDDISGVNANETKFSYWVQASEQSIDSYNFKEKSNSNIITLFKETNFYFPNAFTPHGNNNIFKPVSVGFGGSNYIFQIYNRWGQLIFESTEFDKGWDGTYKGKQSQQGTYVYHLTYKNVFGETKQQQGTVTLID